MSKAGQARVTAKLTRIAGKTVSVVVRLLMLVSQYGGIRHPPIAGPGCMQVAKSSRRARTLVGSLAVEPLRRARRISWVSRGEESIGSPGWCLHDLWYACVRQRFLLARRSSLNLPLPSVIRISVRSDDGLELVLRHADVSGRKDGTANGPGAFLRRALSKKLSGRNWST